MIKKKSRRLYKEKKSFDIKFGLSLVALLIIFSSTVYYLMFRSAPVQINQHDFCPKSNNRNGSTAIIIDTSDTLDAAQLLALESYLDSLTQTSATRTESFLEKGTKLVAYLITNNKTPKQIFALQDNQVNEI